MAGSTSVLLALVEDAFEAFFAGEDFLRSGDAAAGRRLNISHGVDVRAAIIAQSWRCVRLQARFAERIARLSRVAFHIAPTVPTTVSCDVSRICVVLVNLLSTAVDRAGPGGVVEVAAEFSAPRRTLELFVRYGGGAPLSPQELELLSPFGGGGGRAERRRRRKTLLAGALLLVAGVKCKASSSCCCSAAAALPPLIMRLSSFGCTRAADRRPVAALLLLDAGARHCAVRRAACSICISFGFLLMLLFSAPPLLSSIFVYRPHQLKPLERPRRQLLLFQKVTREAPLAIILPAVRPPPRRGRFSALS